MSGWAAAASIAGDLLGGFLSDKSSAKQAKAQRHWEERMSNTAIRRRADDLRAAGFNPMLSFMGNSGAMSGATTPTGSSGRGGDFSGMGSRAVSAFQQAKLATEQVQNLRANTTERMSQSWKNEAEAKEIAERTPSHAANIDRTRQEIENMKTQGKIQNVDLQRAMEMLPEIVRAQKLANEMLHAQMSPVKIMEEMYQQFPALRRIQAIRDIIFGGSGMIKPFNSQ